MANGNNNRAFKVIVALTLVIVILLGIIVYALVLKPFADNYVERKADNARTEVVNTMLAQIQNQGYVRIIDGEGKEIILVPAG